MKQTTARAYERRMELEENLHRTETETEDSRSAISRVVLIVFLFVLLCLIVPSLSGDTKGIPSLRWYGYAVITAGVAALVAGGVVRHRGRTKQGEPRDARTRAIPVRGGDTELKDPWRAGRFLCSSCPE